jgi:hypothetical protein
LGDLRTEAGACGHSIPAADETGFMLQYLLLARPGSTESTDDD